MFPNGYINIDCKKLDLTKGSTPQTVTGLFEASVSALATGKPVFAVNTEWGPGYPMSPIQTFGWQPSESLIIFTASTLQIHVTSAATGNVTIVNMAE